MRIGKWRWPPPKEDGDALAEGFFQFKMRKMKEREGIEDGVDGGAKNDSFETSQEIEGLDWGEEFSKGLKRSQSKDSFTIMEDTQVCLGNQSINSLPMDLSVIKPIGPGSLIN